jgi:hypothetical protein
MGFVGVGLMTLGALIASSANTKSAEAHSNASKPVATSNAQQPIAAATCAPLKSSAPADAATTSHVTVEVITPPPADLNLEDPKLRRMQPHEITPDMLLVAAKIVREHYAKPVGTQIAVDVGGKHLIARIERHFHPEGGAVKPWGFHPGVSLFVLR